MRFVRLRNRRFRVCRQLVLAKSDYAVTRMQMRLLTIGKPVPAASIVDLSARHTVVLPIGSDDEDLVCGACGTVTLAGWSQLSTANASWSMPDGDQVRGVPNIQRRTDCAVG